MTEVSLRTFGVWRRTTASPGRPRSILAGGNDARTIQRTKAGVRVAAVSAAVRYLHAPASVGSFADFENMLKLTRLFLADQATK